MIEDILYQQVLTHYSDGTDSEVLIMPLEEISSGSFDLMDKLDRIEQPEGSGCVTYENHSGIPVKVIDFEKLMNQARYRDKRCDFIVFPSSGSLFFMLNELSISPTSIKGTKAWYQFNATLNVLFKNDQLRDLISECKYKYCIISCRPNKGVSTPLDIAAGFMAPYELIKEPVLRPFQPVNKRGFEIYEATRIKIYPESVSLEF